MTTLSRLPRRVVLEVIETKEIEGVILLRGLLGCQWSAEITLHWRMTRTKSIDSMMGSTIHLHTSKHQLLCSDMILWSQKRFFYAQY